MEGLKPLQQNVDIKGINHNGRIYIMYLQPVMRHYLKFNVQFTIYSSINKDGSCSEFWVWLDSLSVNCSSDKVSVFWAEMLKYLHAYCGFYFAIRSGNWLLRNACLQILTELFFLFTRDKYEVLSIHALSNAYTYPKDILHMFKRGQWTVSVKARPFLNLALDEAHECIVNRKLKQITTMPSHFRMVELADFTAYLDKVVTSLEKDVFRLQKNTEHEKIKKQY